MAEAAYADQTAYDGEASKKSEYVTAQKIKQWFSDAYKASEEYREQFVESLKMLNGDQWPAELAAKLREQNMAPIVINKMLMPVMFLSGVQRQTRQEPKLIPAEAGDVKSTEIMNALVHWVLNQTQGAEIDSRVFLDKSAIGLGWWKLSVDYEGEDIEGRILVRRRHPLAVFADPNWLDAGHWSDAQYVCDALWYTPDEAAEKWPEYKDQFKRHEGEWIQARQGDMGGAATLSEHAGDSLSTDRLFFDPVTKRVRIVECWYKCTKRVTVAINQDTMEATADEGRVQQLQAAVQTLPPWEQQKILFVKKPVTLVRVAHLFMDTLLDDDASPYSEKAMFPLIPTVGNYFWKNPFGLAEMMKDLQREKNKRRSKLIDLVGRMPLSGFINKESGGADPKQIEEYGAGNGVQILYKETPPEPIRPPDLPMAVVRLEDKSDEEIKDVPNVHNELLGQATQKTISGRAIEARQRGGLISHEHLFDTFRLDQAEVVKFLVELIKQHVSPSRALRILGSIAAKQPDSEVGMMMQDQSAIGALQVQEALGEAYDTEYDCVISSRPAEPSLAMQSWETLAELKGQGADIPPKVLYEAAMKAGLLNEEQVAEILAYITGQQAAAMGGQPGTLPPPGAVPPGAVPPEAMPPAAQG